MSLRVTKGMPLLPNTCLLCGTSPTEDDGSPKRAIFAEGVDVDWGNSVYICWECGELIADLMGRATRGGFDDLVEKVEQLEAKYHELKEEHEAQKVFVDKVREGVAARKTLRQESAA